MTEGVTSFLQTLATTQRFKMISRMSCEVWKTSIVLPYSTCVATVVARKT